MCGRTLRTSDTQASRCRCLPLRSGRRTSASAHSLLPTLTATPYGDCRGGGAGREGATVGPSLESLASKGELLPTLTCSRSTYQRRRGKTSPTLPGLAPSGRLPTLVSAEARHGAAIDAEAKRHSPNLTAIIIMDQAPTLTRKDFDSGSANRAVASEMGLPTGRTLHPRFCEWFMGFPQGWTDLDGDDP